MKFIFLNVVVFTLIGPLLVPLWFMIWDSWSIHSSFTLPPLGAWLASTVLFYVFGAIPACVTGLISGALYNKLKTRKRWMTVIICILVTVICGGVMSALAVYILSSVVFSSKYGEPYLLAELAALMGAVSSLFCSILIAVIYCVNRKGVRINK